LGGGKELTRGDGVRISRRKEAGGEEKGPREKKKPKTGKKETHLSSKKGNVRHKGKYRLWRVGQTKVERLEAGRD